jgi:acyl carrier protein
VDNAEKLASAFADALGIDREMVTDSIEFNSIPEWDSVAHMRLIAALETTFDVMMDTEDIIDMSSFKKAREILSKYDVRF